MVNNRERLIEFEDSELELINGGWGLGSDGGGALILSDEERQTLLDHGFLLEENLRFTPGDLIFWSVIDNCLILRDRNITARYETLKRVEELLGPCDTDWRRYLEFLEERRQYIINRP